MGLDIRDMSIDYPAASGLARALRGVSLHLDHAESLCIIGASGSAKTTMCRGILGILPKGTRVSGQVFPPGCVGQSIYSLSAADLREYRRTSVGAIFQDALGSLIPGVPIGRSLERVFRLRRDLGRRDARRAAKRALTEVGFNDPADVWDRPPTAISGGMAQRCMAAFALSAPRLRILCADEPTSWLDSVSAAQVLDLLFGIHRSTSVMLLLVTHDARLVSRCDWVAVLSHGRLVEMQRSQDFVRAPRSDAGRALMEASAQIGATQAPPSKLSQGSTP